MINLTNAQKSIAAIILMWALVLFFGFRMCKSMSSVDLEKANYQKSILERRLHVDDDTVKCNIGSFVIRCNGLTKAEQIINFNCSKDECFILGR